MSRERLAVRIGVSAETIARVERNQNDVAAATAYKISQELDLNLDDMFIEEATA